MIPTRASFRLLGPICSATTFEREREGGGGGRTSLILILPPLYLLSMLCLLGWPWLRLYFRGRTICLTTLSVLYSALMIPIQVNLGMHMQPGRRGEGEPPQPRLLRNACQLAHLTTPDHTYNMRSGDARRTVIVDDLTLRPHRCNVLDLVLLGLGLTHRWCRNLYWLLR